MALRGREGRDVAKKRTVAKKMHIVVLFVCTLDWRFLEKGFSRARSEMKFPMIIFGQKATIFEGHISENM